MAIRNDSFTTNDCNSGAASDLLNKNMLTTAGVLFGGSTAVAAGALVTFALPVQVLGAAAISGGLIYAGDRQSKGLSVNPFTALAGPKAPVMSDDYDHTAGLDPASVTHPDQMSKEEVIAYNLDQAMNAPAVVVMEA